MFKEVVNLNSIKKVESSMKQGLSMYTLRLFKKRVSLNNRIKWDSMRSLKIKTIKTVMKSSYPTMMAMTMSLK